MDTLSVTSKLFGLFKRTVKDFAMKKGNFVEIYGVKTLPNRI